jgi:formate hydrogenlyase subunit 6/NADH:ubiquinone oxidoreductase subunit I
MTTLKVEDQRPALNNRQILLDLLEQLRAPGRTVRATITKGPTQYISGTLVYDETKCILCASCAVSCPAKAIEVDDTGDKRRMVHLHSRCVHCTKCVQVCPETALTIEQGLNLDDMFSGVGRERMKGDLERCPECGRPLGPTLQLDKMRTQVLESAEGTDQISINICRFCRRRHAAEKSLAPGPDEPETN